MLQGLIDGSVTGGCESCELSCGDANADGDVTVADLTQVADVIENDATLSVCQFQAADVKGDGVIDEADLQGIMDIINDFSEGACEPCEVACGDLTQDGSVGPADVELLEDVVAGEESLGAICPRWAADVNGDGDIDAEDLALLEAHVDEGLEISCAGEEGEAGEIDTGIDCSEREQLPSDWVRKTTGSNSCIWTGFSLDGSKDCRFYGETWPQEWPGTTNSRNLTMGPGNGGKEYVAWEFNSGDISPTRRGQIAMENPQFDNAVSAPKIWTFSKCPGDFNKEIIEEEMGPGCYQPDQFGSLTTVFWGGTAEASDSRCGLEANQTYYLNVIYTDSDAGTSPGDLEPHPSCDGGRCGNNLAPTS